MVYHDELRILYVGRQTQISDRLQALFEQQNSIGSKQRYSATETQQIRLAFVAVTNQKAALRLVRTQPPVAILVEIEQKSASRLRLCESIRYRLPTATILAVTTCVPRAHAELFDGFIALPLDEEEVLATIAQISEQREEHQLQCGPISLDIASRTVVTPNGQYAMTPKQCALLKLFMGRHGEVVKRGEIMQAVWETSYLEDTRTLDVHVRWLRERIEANPSKPIYLKTVRGIGYCFKVT
ncbi:MAG: response regulator transcription factor [Caldilineaceae bacterium]